MNIETKKVTHFSGVVQMQYSRSPGKVIGRFLSELKENAKIFANRAGSYAYVFAPPQMYCPHTGKKNDDWIELSGKGSLEYYTIVHYKSDFCEWQRPYALGAIRLDGAHNLMWHRLKDIEGLSNLKGETKVEAVFKEKEERKGSILDIDYFKTI